MADDLLLGVPFITDVPVSRSVELEARAEEQKTQIEACGVNVTKIYLVAPGMPLRFYIQFIPGVGFQARAKLEALGYDIGQRNSSKELGFYAVKRVEMTNGWKGSD